MKIGRALENELVVSDLQVSRYHAEFRAHPDGRYEIVDLGSHNGTYVNGQAVQRHLLGPNDIVGVGHSTFRLVGDRLEEFVDNGAVSFSARRLSVTVPHGKTTKTILRDVSFGVPEKSLIGVIGPSGSGKSTLLRALTGYRPADQGEVLYDNRNLYKQFAELRQRIGLVPQDDILHKELQVRTALRYAAKLRFPGDTATAEREARIDEVLRELKLDIHADKRVTSLSGGQRKRVSVALELLTKPSLIFLDEPTSGLDPGMDRDVMKLLRGLADDGRTVLVVTHSVAELALCDKLLVMAPGGAVAYFGPPDEALTFFGYDNWADVFSAFENYRDYDWSGRWRGSQHYQTYAADLDAAAPQTAHYIPYQAARPPKPQGWGSQLFTLVRRYLSVIISDRGFIGLMVILPAVLGVVSLLIPAHYGLGPGPASVGGQNRDAGTILMIIAVGACFAGSANSVRELIKERVIYERERAVGLSRSAYLMSKVIVLGLITALQGAIICGIGFAPPKKLPTEGLVLHSHPGGGDGAGHHGVRLHLDDVRPDHLGAGQDVREDHAAAGHVRHRADRLHRRALPALRQARGGAAVLADAGPLGGGRRGRHREPQHAAAVGPDHQRRPAVEAHHGHLDARHRRPARHVRDLRSDRVAAAAPARAGGHAEVATPDQRKGGGTNASHRPFKCGVFSGPLPGVVLGRVRPPSSLTAGSVRGVHVVHGAVHVPGVVARGGDVGDRVVDVPGGAGDVVRR